MGGSTNSTNNQLSFLFMTIVSAEDTDLLLTIYFKFYGLNMILQSSDQHGRNLEEEA